MMFRKGRRATVARMHHVAGSAHMMGIRYGRQASVSRVSREADSLIAEYMRELAASHARP